MQAAWVVLSRAFCHKAEVAAAIPTGWGRQYEVFRQHARRRQRKKVITALRHNDEILTGHEEIATKLCAARHRSVFTL